MTARIDHSTSVGQKTAGERDCAAKGLEDRWLKALEQAHLEKQVSAMHSQVVPYDTAEDGTFSGQGPDQAGRFPGSKMERPFCEAPAASSPEAKDTGIGLSAGRTAGAGGVLCESARDAVPWPYQAVNDGIAVSRQPAGHESHSQVEAPRPMDLPAVRRLLPPSSMLTAIDGQDGVHLVIRDASLEASDILRVLEKIREAVSLRKRRLSCVTLNGLCLWKSGAAAYAHGRDDNVIPKEWIDRTF